MNLLETVKFYSTLSNLVRYNTRFRVKDESVAEHSYFVAVISLLIANRVQRELSGVSIDYGLMLEMALVHDLPECEVSDIPHGVKDTLNIRERLKHVEYQFFQTAKYRDVYETVEVQEGLEAKIVKYADVVSVLTYSMREASLGNTNFDDIVRHSEARLAAFEFPKEFNNSIINESGKEFRL